MGESESRQRSEDDAPPAVPASRPTAADGAPGVPAAGAQVATRRVALFGGVAVTALALDLASKILIVANVREAHPHRLVGGVVYLLLTRNGGAAFSIGGSATVVLTAIAVAVAVVIVRTARRLRSAGWAVALGLILGGALGNLVDRVFRAPGVGRGRVVDWISVFADDGHVWPIFNLADSAIICGGVLAAIVAMRGIEFDGTRSKYTTSYARRPGG